MSFIDELAARHDAALRGYGPTVPDEFAIALRNLEPVLNEEDLERWADAGVALASRSLRSWEAAVEYFRAGPAIAGMLPFNLVMYCAETAGRITDASPVVAAAFLRSAPNVFPMLPPERGDSGGIMGEELARRHAGQVDIGRWARMGERLHRGNWKSVALASLFYEISPKLLDTLTLHTIEELVEVVDVLSDRSYQLATICLETAPSIFGDMAPADREPFLRFARSVTRASWADTRLYFERGPELLHSIDPDERSAFLEIASKVLISGGRQGFPQFVEAATALGSVPMAEHATLIELAAQIAKGSPVAAMSMLCSAPAVLVRLTTDQLGQWVEPGARLLFEEGNIEGAEAYFRLESVRAEQTLASLSARVELTNIGATAAHVREGAHRRAGRDPLGRGARRQRHRLGDGVGRHDRGHDDLPAAVRRLLPGAGLELPVLQGVHDTPDRPHRVRRRSPSASPATTARTPHRRSPNARRSCRARERPVLHRRWSATSTSSPSAQIIAALFTIVEDTRIDAYVVARVRRHPRLAAAAPVVRGGPPSRCPHHGPAPGLRREPAACLPRPRRPHPAGRAI